MGLFSWLKERKNNRIRDTRVGFIRRIIPDFLEGIHGNTKLKNLSNYLFKLKK